MSKSPSYCFNGTSEGLINHEYIDKEMPGTISWQKTIRLKCHFQQCIRNVAIKVQLNPLEM